MSVFAENDARNRWLRGQWWWKSQCVKAWWLLQKWMLMKDFHKYNEHTTPHRRYGGLNRDGEGNKNICWRNWESGGRKSHTGVLHDGLASLLAASGDLEYCMMDWPHYLQHLEILEDLFDDVDDWSSTSMIQLNKWTMMDCSTWICEISSSENLVKVLMHT